ncbi:2-phospho-L-lactate transferase CofD family protein [Aeromicrobium sp. UC242_57]|uniref:2-phospho-L-lactate transferase CofD family protein n=1 Tax=Aeromicrobium sp. UC242_57 TaxID=3374624 RepID=UPI003798F3A6
MKITVLSGGVGGARFISGLLAVAAPDDEVTVIGNTADDIWVFGLRVCPDLDTVMYTLGGGIDPERKWGRTDETWHAKEDLTAYGGSVDVVRSRRPRSRDALDPHRDAA